MEKNKKRNKNIRPRNTLRIALVFVAVMLSIQVGFSAIYLYQNHLRSTELRQEMVHSFQSQVEGYYAKAAKLAAELQSSSYVAELGYRRTISQRNIEKVNGLVVAIQKIYAASQNEYADVFVYFPASDTLYNQKGLCDRNDPKNPRYVQLDLDAMLAQKMGSFNIGGQNVVTAKSQYTARVVGVRSSRVLILLTCPDEIVTALSEAPLKLMKAQAAYFDESGERLAASSALSMVTLEEVPKICRSGLDGLKDFSFSMQTANGATLMIGFGKNLPNEIFLRNNLMIISANIFCLLAIAFFSFVYHRQLYRPMQRVVAQTQYDREKDDHSEFLSIAQQMEDDRREIDQISEKYNIEHQRRTLNDLALGLNGGVDAFPESPGAYVVLSIVCESPDGAEAKGAFSSLSHALEQSWNAHLFYRQGKQQLFMIFLGEKPVTALVDFLVECAPGSNAQIAMSHPHEVMTELYCAMDEASSTLLFQPATVQGEGYRIILCRDAQNNVLFQGASPALDTSIRYCLESGNAEGCRALLEPLYEKNQGNSVMAQQEMCLHLLNLLQKPGDAKDRQQLLVDIRSIFNFDNMWEIVMEQLEDVKSSDPQKEKAWQQMEQYIRKNFTIPELSLQSVATHMGWSYSYASRFFKQMNGGSFTNYVTNLRIEEAKRLLVQGDLPVNEILPKVGFSVFGSFSRSFKKATGFSPSEYRSKVSEEAPRQADEDSPMEP